ncbi:MAG: M56 family metallopeptidase [Fuerstiella sp.]
MIEGVNDLMAFLNNEHGVRWMVTLLHFLWQGTIVGVLVIVAAKWLRSASATIRYAVYCAGLLSLPVCVITTFLMVSLPATAIRPAGNLVTMTTASTPEAESVFREMADQFSNDASSLETASKPTAAPLAETLTSDLFTPQNPVPADTSLPFIQRLGLQLASWDLATWNTASWNTASWNLVAWGLMAYVCGVVWFLLRLAIALGGGHRLRRQSNAVVDSRLIKSVQQQALQMGLRFVPAVAYCQRVAVPIVIGVLRPMILLPASISTGLSSQELSAIVSHELAHVRRYDLWMNLLQRLIESLLFFHPVVWFLSRRLSTEREICCDDMVVRSGHPPMDYAGALLRMAELCVSTNKSQLASLAAAGHSTAELERRIQRLMNIKSQSRLRLTSAGVVAVAALLIAIVFTPTLLSAFTEPDGLTDESVVKEKIADPSSQNIPTEWDFETGQNVRWKMPLGSVTMRAPVVSEDHVFVGTNNEHAYLKRLPKQNDLGVLLCFNKFDGQLKWQHSNKKRATGHLHDWPLQGVTSRPCVLGNRLWYVTNRGEIVCLDTQGFHDSENDGPVQDEESTQENEADVIWRFDMMAELGVSPHNLSTCTVAVWEDRVFAVTGNGVGEDHKKVAANAPSFIAVDKDSGKLLWADDSPGANVLHGQWGSPVVADLAGRTQVIFPGGDGWLYSFDPRGHSDGTGKLIWKFDCNPKKSVWKLGGAGTRNNLLHAPTIYDGLLYIAMGQDPEHGSGPGAVWCIDPSGTGDVSPQLVFMNKAEEWPESNSLKPDRRIQACVVEHGDVTRPNPNSKAVWQFSEQDVDGNGELAYEETMSRSLSTIAIQGDLLFVSDINGILHCLDRRTGSQHWGYDLQATVYSTPTIAGDHVFLCDEDGFVSVFKCSADPMVACPDGKPVRQMSAEHSVNASAVVDGNTMFIATRSELFAIEASQNPVEQEPDADQFRSDKTPMANDGADRNVGHRNVGDLDESDSARSDVGSGDPPQILYPHCIVKADHLVERSLIEAIAKFNLTARESPIGVRQAPLSLKETRTAIRNYVSRPQVAETVRIQLNEVLRANRLPPNIYFRRFTRFDDEQQMHGVWWVRLCIESETGPLTSVSIREIDLYSRPYTQLERRQNSQPGVTLINRFSSYFENMPTLLLLATLPAHKQARLVDRMKAAIANQDFDKFESLCNWAGVDDRVRQFAKEEFQMLTQSNIHSVKISPKKFRGNLLHWSAYQRYQPNAPVIGYLEIQYSLGSKDAAADEESADRKTVSLEIGNSGDDFQLVNYIETGERKFPKKLTSRLSVRGHVESLSDGTFFVTSLTTNPGTLISAHLANEEIWQRDLRRGQKTDDSDD